MGFPDQQQSWPVPLKGNIFRQKKKKKKKKHLPDILKSAHIITLR